MLVTMRTHIFKTMRTHYNLPKADYVASVMYLQPFTQATVNRQNLLLISIYYHYSMDSLVVMLHETRKANGALACTPIEAHA